MRYQFALIIGTGMSLAASAQRISVRADLESDSMMIGDQVEFGIHVEADEDVNFRMPALADTLTGELEILRRIRSDTVRSDGRVTVDHSYLVTGFDAGAQQVPSQEVPFQSGGGWDTARSLPVAVTVFEPEVDTTQQIKPIKPPINTPLSLAELLPWIGLGFGIAVLATLIYFWIYYRKKKKLPGSIMQKPLEPPHVTAFRELDKLKEAKLWERGEVKRYYTRLTEIIRQYIERQYEIPAMEHTSEEIISEFRRSNLEDELLDDMLKELLEMADLVKFAKGDPLPVDNQTNLNNAYIFVQKTYPMFHGHEPEERPDKGKEEKQKLEEAVNE